MKNTTLCAMINLMFNILFWRVIMSSGDPSPSDKMTMMHVRIPTSFLSTDASPFIHRGLLWSALQKRLSRIVRYIKDAPPNYQTVILPQKLTTVTPHPLFLGYSQDARTSEDAKFRLLVNFSRTVKQCRGGRVGRNKKKSSTWGRVKWTGRGIRGLLPMEKVAPKRFKNLILVERDSSLLKDDVSKRLLTGMILIFLWLTRIHQEVNLPFYKVNVGQSNQRVSGHNIVTGWRQKLMDPSHIWMVVWELSINGAFIYLLQWATGSYLFICHLLHLLWIHLVIVSSSAMD